MAYSRERECITRFLLLLEMKACSANLFRKCISNEEPLTDHQPNF